MEHSEHAGHDSSTYIMYVCQAYSERQCLNHDSEPEVTNQ